MKIGNPATFTVVFELNSPMTPWLFGKFAYVVADSIVGNYDDGCSLRAAVEAMKNLLGYTGQRQADAKMMEAPTDEVFDQINRALYVDSGQSDDKIQADRTFYWRFQTKNIGLDVFDGWKCYLLENSRKARFLWCNEKANAIRTEAALQPGEFDRVLTEFVNFIEKEYGSIMSG